MHKKPTEPYDNKLSTDEYVKLYDSLYKFLRRPPRKAELEREVSEYIRRSKSDRV